MKKVSNDIEDFYKDLGKGSDGSLARIAQRGAQVRDMWAACVQGFILEHTNAVYIINEEGEKTLIVYVDDSICASELNARRELIKLKFLQDFNEDISEMRIIISRGRYKRNHPFLDEGGQQARNTAPPRPLSSQELERIQEAAAQVDDPVLREAFSRAMAADLQGKEQEGGKSP